MSRRPRLDSPIMVHCAAVFPLKYSAARRSSSAIGINFGLQCAAVGTIISGLKTAASQHFERKNRRAELCNSCFCFAGLGRALHDRCFKTVMAWFFRKTD